MRVIIVEDELRIREGLGMLLERFGHTVLGEAADGVSGLEMTLRFKPDLVITDINMPKMDGLEMIGRISEQKLPVHIVILTGYSEFDYAKQAIRYGVDEYLLKPLAAEDVKEMLDKVEDAIYREQLAGGTPEIYLRNLITCEEKEVEKNCEALEQICGFPAKGGYEAFVGYFGNMPSKYREDIEEAFVQLQERYSEIILYHAVLDSRQKVYAVACDTSGRGKLSDLEKSVYNRLILREHGKPEQPVWTRERFTDLKMLKKVQSIMEERIGYALSVPAGGWLTEENMQAFCPAPYTAPADIMNRLRSAVCREDRKKVKEEAEKFLGYMKEYDFCPEDIRSAFIKIYYLICETVQDINRPVFGHLQNSNILRQIETAVTWSEMERAFRDIIRILSDSRIVREDISNYVIKKVINYIREHYQESITQEEISREMDITPEYLSTLFNREMGINFSTFLKKFRISHAKRLLKGTDMKIYEIASSVGYSDPKYFQRVFKDETGVSPGDYRQMN